ncbi:MAG: PAS domain-containing protein [Actinomycetota bacterium]|nr:PAS domain-containing protein [Actinomycetota bacterium]
MPIFICPNCGDRSVSTERTAGFQNRARACHKCGFGFVFELLDDYYPAPNAAFFLLDQQGRLIGTGRGARELTGLGDLDVIGRDAAEVLHLDFESGDDHIAIALEWGVRVLDKQVVVHAEGDRPESAKADIFPAYDDDGGLLLVLTPR